MKKSLLWITVMALSLSMVAVFSLYGCKAEEEAEEAVEEVEEEAVEEVEEEAVEEVEEEATGEIIQLTHWEMLNGPEDIFIPAVEEKVVQKFNEEHPNIQVNIEFKSWDGYYETFLTAVTGGAAPDSSTGSFDQAFLYAQMDEVLDLSSIVEEWKQEGVDIEREFLPGSFEVHQYNGQQIGLPWNVFPVWYAYRADIFEEVGITELPRTYEDFLSVCRTIKEKTDLIPLSMAGTSHNGHHFIVDLLFKNGVGYVDENGNAAFTDQRVIETLEFIETLYREELISPASAGIDKGASIDLYTSGDAAILFAPWDEVYTGFPGVSENTETLPAFAGPSGEPANLTWITVVLAYSQTEHPEETKTWLKYWSENNLPFWTEGGMSGIPVRASFRSDEFFSNSPLKQDLISKVIPDATNATFPSDGMFKGYSVIEGELYPQIALQEILTGNTNLEEIANQVNELIKKAVTE